jgi:hypothetical protein
LAALALASVLMLAAFGVLAGVAHQDISRPKSREMTAIASAAEQIRRDLIDARRFRIDTDQITLTGFCSLNPDTLAPDHRPVRVTYRIDRDDGIPRLIRRQESLDLLSNHNAWSELVCDKVEQLSVTPLSAPPPPTTRPWDDPFSPADGDEMVNSLRIRLAADGGKIVSERSVCVR